MTLQFAADLDVGPSPKPLFLVEEFNHRVLNEYAEAISALSLAAVAAPDARSELALTSAAMRLRAHADAHRALQAPIYDGPMDLAAYIAQLCASLSKAQLAERGVRLTVRADEVWVDPERGWRVGLIVAELIRNASRHGLSGGPGAIGVEIIETADSIACSVYDNGRGASGPVIGRGRRVVMALADELGGEVAWSFAPTGCCARLEFPRFR
jgi:two-component sensor histidine kinase